MEIVFMCVCVCLCNPQFLFPRDNSSVPCVVCAVQSTDTLLVQSKPRFQSGGELQPGASLLYEVSLCFYNTALGRWKKHPKNIHIGCLVSLYIGTTFGTGMV